MKILDIKNISTLSIKVTEKIAKKNLLQFIRTSILHSELPFSKTSYFYFNYLPNSSTYEIILYDKSSNNIILEPFLLLNDLSKEKDLVQVYITENYFLVSKDNKPLILKEISDTSKDDVIIYLKQIYKIQEFELVYIKKEDINNLKNKDCTLKDYEQYSLYPQKSFTIFLLFLVSSFIVFISIIYMNFYYEKVITPISKIKVESNIINNQNKPINTTIDIFNDMIINDVQIDTISFVNNKLKMTLHSNSKTNLINFVSKYKKKVKIKSVKYDTSTTLHSMEVIIEI